MTSKQSEVTAPNAEVTAAATVRYATTITRVGPMVPEFMGQGMLILFGEGAPEELHEFCALHRPEVSVGGIRAGDELWLDEGRFSILAVGDVADTNLVALGHVSLKMNGCSAAELAGDVCLEQVTLSLREGSRLRIVAGNLVES